MLSTILIIFIHLFIKKCISIILISFSVNLSIFSIMVNCYLLSLLHSIVEAVYSSTLQEDLSITNLPHQYQFLQIPHSFKAFSTVFKNSFFIRLSADGTIDHEKDSFFLLAKEFDTIRQMYSIRIFIHLLEITVVYNMIGELLTR